MDVEPQTLSAHSPRSFRNIQDKIMHADSIFVSYPRSLIVDQSCHPHIHFFPSCKHSV